MFLFQYIMILTLLALVYTVLFWLCYVVSQKICAALIHFGVIR